MDKPSILAGTTTWPAKVSVTMPATPGDNSGYFHVRVVGLI